MLSTIHKPRTMKFAVLTAAVQNIVLPDQFRTDPIGAAMESATTWIKTARDLGIGLQLSAALPVPDSYIPAAAMLDPVAAHLAVRSPKNGDGTDLSDDLAKTIIDACGSDVKIHDLGCFENLLQPDDAIRKQVHDHTLRVARAAVKLKPVGCDGVTGFIGANPYVDMDQNLDLFELYVIPLLRELDQLGVKFYVENCPMPGWNTTDFYFNNIASTPYMWTRLQDIAAKHGLAHMFLVTYDDSHSILMGSNASNTFNAVKNRNLIKRFHGKDQQRNAALVALHTLMGQRAGLGCRSGGQPDPNPANLGRAWGRMTAAHSMPGVSHYNPERQNRGECTDWLAHQLGARSILGLNPEETVFILEHEWNPARVQDLELVKEMLQLSIAFISGIDQAADAIYRAEAWCRDRNLPFPGVPCPLFQPPAGL